MVKTITKEQWKSSQKNGYTSIKKGQRYILDLTPKGTALVPVSVTGMRKLSKR